ncbi:sulfite exporter TauE/SafE family protein [Caloramator proteoclasticus]|uniref:Probable membrane transporter protein n=1 Tax=Caloramator proteoclasticus DSM 10124 TaxID=1121262 RepID=A0A1M5AZ44_9CLOT|nr:sulfite exporter TauE/SafE family protein [Caloramator proteoclasticus]SHF35505.1 Sulfite exporter TauE/SafE [Caloramator proteoclasticus DSM 10124]
MIRLILGVLIITAFIFLYYLMEDVRKVAKNGFGQEGSFVGLSVVGFITLFFDTLGIGSFAPATSMFKIFKLTDERTIPGTLNVSMTIPIILEALIFIRIIEVDIITLITMITASVFGAILGAGIVSKLNKKKVIFSMGMALLFVATLMVAGQLNILPVGGEAIGLRGGKLIFAVVANFILGALMTIGIGLYAPCMALVYALGMSPKVAFPIMMGSCAFLMPAASIKFIKEGAYDKKAAVAITLFGSIGVLIAAFIVKQMRLDLLKWVVIVVILYTSFIMFKSLKKYTTEIFEV